MASRVYNDGVPLNPRAPKYLLVCDYCGKSLHLEDSKYIQEWSGPMIQNFHFRVCSECWDIPQEQLRSIVLPPDPIPAWDPRPEYYLLDNGLLGWTPNILNPEGPFTTPSQLLQSARANGWAGTVPAQVTATAVTMGPAFFPTRILNIANTINFLVVYNPTVQDAAISQSNTFGFGNPVSVTVGCGQALVMNPNSSLPPPAFWFGNIYGISTFPSSNLFVLTNGTFDSLDFRLPQNSMYLPVIGA